VLVKALLPSSWFEWLHLKDEEMTEEESKQSLVTSLRKSFRDAVKKQSSLRVADG
jgi:asparagine synthetase B (glutamine-hydrolysing)